MSRLVRSIAFRRKALAPPPAIVAKPAEPNMTVLYFAAQASVAASIWYLALSMRSMRKEREAIDRAYYEMRIAAPDEDYDY